MRAMSKGLPPLLRPGLKVVLVGTEPGSESLRTKSYYANSRNSFWRDLHAAGCTATMLAPADFRRALTFGIGLDDVYGDPAAFRRRILEAAPRAVYFNSKAALARVAGDDVSPPWSGAEASRWVRFPGVLVWVLHDSSPMASTYWALRLEELRALWRRIEQPGDSDRTARGRAAPIEALGRDLRCRDERSRPCRPSRRAALGPRACRGLGGRSVETPRALRAAGLPRQPIGVHRALP